MDEATNFVIQTTECFQTDRREFTLGSIPTILIFFYNNNKRIDEYCKIWVPGKVNARLLKIRDSIVGAVNHFCNNCEHTCWY